MNGVESTDSNQECKIGFETLTNGVSQCLAYTMKLCKIQTVPGFAQNVNFSTFPILF